MDPMIYLVAAVIVAVVLWFVTRSNANRPEQPEADNNDQAIRGNQQGVTRRRRNARMGIQQRAQGAREQDPSPDEDADDILLNKDGKIGTKKLKKLQEKEERKKMRELEAIEREDRKKELAAKEELRKIEEEKKLKEEERIEEEKKKAAEEKERKEHEEYLELKAMFSVDEEGHQALNADEESQNLLVEFVEYVKSKKVVLLEDLASHFGLRTQDTIDRVQTMLKDEILTGVIDDRGKFIYISNEELAAVAKFIRQRGRVSISDLAQASNSLINLASENVTEA